jgi:MFS family permease
MKYQGFFPLFVCSFAILFVGFGLFPLLPVYAVEFGATPTLTGFYLAATYTSITLGTLLTGLLPRGISRKAMFVIAGVLGVPALYLMGHAIAFWQVIILTCLVWFTGGIGLSLISVFIGLQANDSSRGKWFALLALTNPLGAVLGGLAVSWMVGWRGYPQMFTLLGLVYAIWPLVGLLKVKDKPGIESGQTEPTKFIDRSSNFSFRLLILAVLFSAITVSIVRMGLSLSMKAIHMTPAAISGSNVIGGLVTIPVVLGIGALSDRLGHKLLLSLGYLLAVLGSLVLLQSNRLWHFWIVSAAILISRSINTAIASALAADILPKTALKRNLPFVNTMAWISGVLGFALTGYMIDTVGSGDLYLIAAILSLVSVGLVSLMSRTRWQIKINRNIAGSDYTKLPVDVRPERSTGHNYHIIDNSVSRKI